MRRRLKMLAALFTVGLAGCTSLPFYPVKEISLTPAAIQLPYEDVRIATQDGEHIAGWFIPAGDDAGKPASGCALLFFHGNAGNISHRLDSIAIFHKLGFSQLIIDYRGFGQSTGEPSVNGTLLDAAAAWKWLTETKGFTPGRIVIFGRSLGGGVAAAQAARTPPRALILESTFTRLYDVASDMFPWLPVRLFLPQDYDTPGNLAKVRVPLLVVHSPDDEVISYRLGRRLYDGYAGPKRFLELRGSHNTGFRESIGEYTRGLEDFLREVQEPERTE